MAAPLTPRPLTPPVPTLARQTHAAASECKAETEGRDGWAGRPVADLLERFALSLRIAENWGVNRAQMITADGVAVAPLGTTIVRSIATAKTVTALLDNGSTVHLESLGTSIRVATK